MAGVGAGPVKAGALWIATATLGVQAGATGMLLLACCSNARSGGGTGRLHTFWTLGVQLGASGAQPANMQASASAAGGGFIGGTAPPIAGFWKSIDARLSKPQVTSATVLQRLPSLPREVTCPEDSI